MEKSALEFIGGMLFKMRFLMSFFYMGLVVILVAILWRFLSEIPYLITSVLGQEIAKIDLIIKVLELVDITMVAQLVWVVALAGFSLFVTNDHFEGKTISKPDWLDHVNTYNLKLKLGFAIISISGVHALKTYLEGSLPTTEIMFVVGIHVLFVLAAIGIALSEYLARASQRT
ncbi:YqhA family protein [Patescibacteria group bacterium]|nr:YqhA family protein [Patescibacteria group bacterium]